MEFDKSKILTVVTADQAKVGQKGWFGDMPCRVENDMNHLEAEELVKVWPTPKPFQSKSMGNSALFYPAPQPTYAERQAQWVKDNGVKVGDKVKFIKDFTSEEDGSRCCTHYNVLGRTGVVDIIKDTFIWVAVDGLWSCPYTALELVKEPTYRPFKNAEEFKPYRDEWFVLKDITRIFAPVRVFNYSKYGVIFPNRVKGNEVSFFVCTWDELFKRFTRENGEPCGMKEE